ncbi:hypothetical protein X769_13985 [Mesorhizobium sp. LSJC268A00]|nr:hypothetical protein X769_13985 [Mesorhizobium sp. LSJC268A00]
MPESFDIVLLLWLTNGPQAASADLLVSGLAVLNRPLGATDREYAKDKG